MCLYRCERRLRTLSVGSGGCEGLWDGQQYQHVLCEGVEGPDSGSDSPWLIQHTHTDADSDNWSLYTADSQDDTQQHTGCRTYSRTGKATSPWCCYVVARQLWMVAMWLLSNFGWLLCGC